MGSGWPGAPWWPPPSPSRLSWVLRVPLGQPGGEKGKAHPSSHPSLRPRKKAGPGPPTLLGLRRWWPGRSSSPPGAPHRMVGTASGDPRMGRGWLWSHWTTARRRWMVVEEDGAGRDGGAGGHQPLRGPRKPAPVGAGSWWRPGSRAAGGGGWSSGTARPRPPRPGSISQLLDAPNGEALDPARRVEGRWPGARLDRHGGQDEDVRWTQASDGSTRALRGDALFVTRCCRLRWPVHDAHDSGAPLRTAEGGRRASNDELLPRGATRDRRHQEQPQRHAPIVTVGEGKDAASARASTCRGTGMV